MGKAHFVLFCDKGLVAAAVPLILESNSRIEVVSSRIIETEIIDNTTDVYHFRRGFEKACVAIIVGDRRSEFGPYEREYWILVDGERESYFRYNKKFAMELVRVLVANGARVNLMYPAVAGSK